MDTVKRDYDIEVALKNLLLKVGLVEEMSDTDLKIEMLIRQKYSMSMETKIHREKLMGKIDDEEWNNYCNYIQECIDTVYAEENERKEV